jgi:DNA primase
MGNNGRTIPEAVIIELKEIPIHSVCDMLGVDYKGDCPSGHDSQGHNCFHTFENTNTWNCFHCKDAGEKLRIDTIGLVETALKYNFPDACNYLIEHFKPELKDKFTGISAEELQKITEKRQKTEQVYKALDYAIDYYNSKLWENKEAVNYLTGRGIKEEFIRDNPYVKFGLAPLKQEDLKQELFSKFGEEITLATGLFSKSDKDFIFPTMKKWIEELKKEIPVITYSYQVGGQARYVIGRRFTPEMEGEIKDANRFSKMNLKKGGIIKNEIFGIDSLSIKNPLFKNSVLISEGLFDAILAIQAGIPTISPVTVTFSDSQINEMQKLVRRFETVYIVPDPDSPGEKGAVKTAKQLIKEGKNVKVVTLPRIEGVKKFDLADYFKIYSPEDFFKLVDESVSLIDFLIQSIPQNTEKTGLKKLLEDKGIIETIHAMDAITQEHYREVLSERFKLETSTVKSLFELAGMEIKQAVKGKPLPPRPEGAGEQEPGEKKEEYPPLVGFTLRELMEEEFPPIKYLVQDILPEGLTILAGKPKIGKSIFALNISLSIAKGCITLGKFTTEKTDVAYFALEDHKRRLKKRTLPGLNQMIQDHKDIPDNFTFFNSLLPLQKGGFEQLNSYLEAHPEIKFIVIDTIGRVKNPSYKGNSYEVDTQLYSKLHEIYLKKNVSILVITHTKKQEALDFVDNVTGSAGGTGVADTVLVLNKNRTEKEAVLKVTGRDIEEEEELALRLNPDLLSWEVLGNADLYTQNKERTEIINILLKDDMPMNNKTLAEITGKNYQAIRLLTYRMEKDGLLRKVDNNKYILSSSYYLSSSSSMSSSGSISSSSSMRYNNNDNVTETVIQSATGATVTLNCCSSERSNDNKGFITSATGATGATVNDQKIKCSDCKFSTVLNSEKNLYRCDKGEMTDYNGLTERFCCEFKHKTGPAEVLQIEDYKRRYNSCLVDIKKFLQTGQKHQAENIMKLAKEELLPLEQAGISITEEDLREGFALCQ